MLVFGATIETVVVSTAATAVATQVQHLLRVDGIAVMTKSRRSDQLPDPAPYIVADRLVP